ncbi:type II toxin-antitoxin system RelE/ParE family toxin [Mycobacterium sp. 3519A]|uniref:type II toxin-antitoxin system RelE/ParE family toxin n=1 Tax=Mycobacterium sp. 3519A TaxID=2057184 RepID=UPI000C7B0174|nr:type II toxin-antitoxin system RelE/ParE family toxin [Mycobacterium sp. 3519A]
MADEQWDVILLEEVEEWFFSLDTDEMTTVAGAIDLLEMEGPTLGRPVVDRVKGSRFHSMKELRPAATSIRILFIFDPLRRAILLLGGDKAGTWKSWYDKNIPVAEARYDSWLENEGGG